MLSYSMYNSGLGGQPCVCVWLQPCASPAFFLLCSLLCVYYVYSYYYSCVCMQPQPVIMCIPIIVTNCCYYIIY